MTTRNKMLITIAAAVIAVLAHFSILDQKSLEYTEVGLKRALVTFGVSRGLNGVISVVQGTEVAVEPVGIGMTFTPGQILDPVNDLVERFSTIVLVAGTAFGLQRVAIEVTSAQIFSLLVSGMMLLALLCLWFPAKVNLGLRAFIYKATMVLVITRFCIPAIAIGGELFYQQFLQPQFESSSQQLKSTTDQLRDLQSQVDARASAGEESSFLESARSWMRSAGQTLDLQQHLERFKVAAEEISEHAVRLMVVFLFQTVLLPLFSLWLVLKILRGIIVHRPTN